MTNWLGIDVAKLTLQVALKIEGCRSMLEAVFDNTPSGFARLDRWCRRHANPLPHACLEATGIYGDALADHLFEQGYSVSVVNPLRIKAYGQSQLRRTKTDPPSMRG